MAKRTAETYLTDQNWDKEEPEEEAGVFSIATDNVLKNRSMLTAKRRCSAKGNETDNQSGAFKAFTGLTGGRRMEEDVSSFSFRMPLTSDSNNAQKCMKMNALNKCMMEFISSHLSKDASCDLTPVFDDYQSHVHGILAQCGDAQPSATTSAGMSVPTDSGQVPLSQLFQKSLDTWECPTCMITNKNTDTTCAACCDPKPTTGHDAPTSSVESTKASSISFAPGGGFTFSPFVSGQTSHIGSTGFGFKPQATCVVAPFSFSSPVSTCSSSTAASVASADSSVSAGGTGFTFSAPQQLGAAASSLGTAPFSFAGTSGFSFKPPASSLSEKKDEAKGDTEEYVPQKPESVKHVEEGSFYSVRCKLFCKDGDSWKDRGTGYLFLKPCSGRTQLLIRADTATGNILLNILLTSSIPVGRQGTNNVSLVCVPTDPQSSGDDRRGKTAPVCMLIRVKTSEMADELYSHVSECKDE